MVSNYQEERILRDRVHGGPGAGDASCVATRRPPMAQIQVHTKRRAHGPRTAPVEKLMKVTIENELGDSRLRNPLHLSASVVQSATWLDQVKSKQIKPNQAFQKKSQNP